MTITFHLAPEDEADLNDIAARKGQNADALAYDIFAVASAEFKTNHFASAGAQPLPEDEVALEEENEAIRLGLEDSFAGRVTPLAEWSARFRSRHNIPESIQPMTHEEALRLP